MAAIEVARVAYDKLSDVEKAMVSNYKVLLAAEKKLDAIRNGTDTDWTIWIVALLLLAGAGAGGGVFVGKKKGGKRK